MHEYAITVKSTDVGLTWETHFKAKKQFEVGWGMKMIICKFEQSIDYIAWLWIFSVQAYLILHLCSLFPPQGTDLRRIFHFIVNLLGEVVKVEGKMNDELSALLQKLLMIAEMTLTWSFISLHYILSEQKYESVYMAANLCQDSGNQWPESPI